MIRYIGETVFSEELWPGSSLGLAAKACPEPAQPQVTSTLQRSARASCQVPWSQATGVSLSTWDLLSTPACTARESRSQKFRNSPVTPDTEGVERETKGGGGGIPNGPYKDSQKTKTKPEKNRDIWTQQQVTICKKEEKGREKTKKGKRMGRSRNIGTKFLVGNILEMSYSKTVTLSVTWKCPNLLSIKKVCKI